MEREYIRIKKPSPLPDYTSLQRKLNDKVWKEMVLYHLLMFYKHYDIDELKNIIISEKKEAHPRVERIIAKYLRKYLKNNRKFDLQFDVYGEVTNDEDIEGNYDIVISNTYWENKYYFECKNLKDTTDLINKYIYCKINKNGEKISDGGIYRYFNGKYAQNQNFGGMIGFVLAGTIAEIKSRIINKLDTPFDISPEGDLKRTRDKSIEGNEFTFTSIHSRFGEDFTIDHLLFDLQLS